jgi:hypothetical protein
MGVESSVISYCLKRLCVARIVSCNHYRIFHMFYVLNRVLRRQMAVGLIIRILSTNKISHIHWYKQCIASALATPVYFAQSRPEIC